MAVENEKRLKAVGPIDPENGFPLWFEDENGERLELGINPDPLNPDPLIPAIGELPQPAEPLSFPDNFPDESFYFLAEAELEVGGNGVRGRARVILALEAAFGGAGDPKEGLNVVFARIRVRMDDLIPGEKYTVTHPYGVIDDLEADDRGRVFYTEDLGIVETDPTAVLVSGKVAPFLKGTTTVPDGYIGDGVTEQQVTGSPFNTNFVRIKGANIGDGVGNPDPSEPNNRDLVWTNQFTVQGRKAKRFGAWLDSATYSRNADGSYLLNVQARSGENQDLRLVGTGIHFKLDGEGKFYTGLGRVTTTLPGDAWLVNVSDSPPTSYPVTFTDRVIVESAIHDRLAGTLIIKAKSSDSTAVLTLPQLNNLQLNSNPQSYPRRAVPAEIIVKSDKGREGRQWVEVTGTPASNQSVKAIIAPVTAAFAEETVTLDGSVSLGATNFTWTQTVGATVMLTGGNTDKVTFTPPAAGDYTFNLRVGGNNGSSDNTNISFTVQPKPAPDNPVASRVQYRTGTRQFRIDGTVDRVPNTILVKFRGQEMGQSSADVNGAWSVKKTLLTSESNLVPRIGDQIQVSSRGSGGEKSFDIIIRN